MVCLNEIHFQFGHRNTVSKTCYPRKHQKTLHPQYYTTIDTPTHYLWVCSTGTWYNLTYPTSTMQSITTSFHHCRKYGTFIYTWETQTSAYALGYELSQPPQAHSLIAIYTVKQPFPIFVGKLDQIIKHWDDCVDIRILPSPHHHLIRTPPFVLHIPEDWYEFSHYQYLRRKYYLRFHNPPACTTTYTNHHPIYFSHIDKETPLSPTFALLDPSYQYSPILPLHHTSSLQTVEKEVKKGEEVENYTVEEYLVEEYTIACL